jgi:metallo-beta-lactamase class B
MKYFTLLFLLPVILFGQSHRNVELSSIEDSIWIHTTYKQYGSYDIASNGLIIQTSAGLVLIDTPWNDSLMVELLDITRKRFNQDITLAIITHAHDDRIGGIRTLHKKGIKVFSIALTCKKAKELGFEVPEPVISTDTTFIFGNEQIEYFYPGAGHTVDNSVVWINKRKILFGGCLVKAGSFTNLGNIADADLKEWPRSIQVLMKKFSTARIVVPGHGTWGGKDLLQHTLDLLSVK